MQIFFVKVNAYTQEGGPKTPSTPFVSTMKRAMKNSAPTTSRQKFLLYY